MPDVRRCPACGSEIDVAPVLGRWSDGMDILCQNTSDHEDGEPCIMWPTDGDLPGRVEA